jgi:hypothetical protein
VTLVSRKPKLARKFLLIPSYCIAKFSVIQYYRYFYSSEEPSISSLLPLPNTVYDKFILMTLYSQSKKISGCFRRPYFKVIISFIQQVLLQLSLTIIPFLTLGVRVLAGPVAPSRIGQLGSLHLRQSDQMPSLDKRS